MGPRRRRCHPQETRTHDDDQHRNNATDIYNVIYNYRNNNLALLFGVGTVAWSTAGNDGPNAWLDLMTDWSGTTSWGNTVWYGQYGIADTAQRASIY